MGVRILSDYRLPDGRIVQVDSSAAKGDPLDVISNPDEDDPEHITLANITDLLDKLEDRIGDKIDAAVAEILAELRATK